jgi:hypothetical protein
VNSEQPGGDGRSGRDESSVKTKPEFSVSLLKSLADRLRFMNTQIK